MDFVPRPEFDLLIKTQNGRLGRIEAQNTEILNELKAVRADIGERVTWDSFGKQKDECREEFRKMRGRPSWLVATALTLLSSLAVGLVTGILLAVLK